MKKYTFIFVFTLLVVPVIAFAHNGVDHSKVERHDDLSVEPAAENHFQSHNHLFHELHYGILFGGIIAATVAGVKLNRKK